jgi:quinoprotein glucose dehydrogenase
MLMIANKMLPLRNVLEALKANLSYFAVALALSGCMSGDFDSFIVGPEVAAEVRNTSQWANYAGAGSRRATKLEQINKDNIADLEVAWTFRSGDLNSIFQSTPILVNGRLVLCTPHNQVIAIDPLTGAEFWRFDPDVAKVDYPNQANCRAVAQWHSTQVPNQAIGQNSPCKSRIFVATNDARLIAIDGTTGQRCKDFGESGEVLLKEGVGELWWPQEYQVTSPPSVIGDVVVVGSAIADNQRVDAPSGVVRGFDTQSGELVWAFDLAPPSFDYSKGLVSDEGYALATPNVWAGFAVDLERDLIFLPTGNPAPDYYRDGAEDMGHYGSSVVALRGSTGEYVWHFQTVKKDFWDFDVPSIHQDGFHLCA